MTVFVANFATTSERFRGSRNPSKRLDPRAQDVDVARVGEEAVSALAGDFLDDAQFHRVKSAVAGTRIENEGVSLRSLGTATDSWRDIVVCDTSPQPTPKTIPLIAH